MQPAADTGTARTPAGDPLAAVALGGGPLTLDTAVLVELGLLEAGQELFAELVDQFADVTSALLLELRGAVATGDRAAVGRIAHSIKGSGGQLGGRALAAACARTEEGAARGALALDESALHDVEVEYRALTSALHQLASTAT